MWLIVPLILLLVFVLIGGALVGGIYADVLIPIVVIILVAVSVLIVMRRRPRGPDGRPKDPGSAGFPPPVGGAQTSEASLGQTSRGPSPPEAHPQAPDET
jgi:uncharacterized membrane protein YfcA